MPAESLFSGGASLTTEPAAGSSSGTDVSLRDYLDQSVSALEKRIDQRFDLNDRALAAALLAAKEATDKALTAAKEAVDKAEAAANKRFEATNEFRAQLSDQATTFQRRDLAESESRALAAQIEANRTEIAAMRLTVAGQLAREGTHQEVKSDGRADMSVRIAAAAFLVSLVLGTVGLIVAVVLR